MFTNRVAVPHLLLCVLLATGCAAVPDTPPPTIEIRVLSSNGVRSVLGELRPEIEGAIGYALSFEFSTAASLKKRIDGGEPFDVAILTPALVDALIAEGKAAADSRTDVARVGVGIGVREGTPPADISTPEGLKNALLQARSVAFGADGQSRTTIDRAFAHLGIADAMRQKTVLKGPGEAPAAVVAGEVEMVITLLSEILSVPGLELLGPLPDALQGYVSFAAARSTTARDAAAANALLHHFSDATVAAAMKAGGLDPAAIDAGSR